MVLIFQSLADLWRSRLEVLDRRAAGGPYDAWRLNIERRVLRFLLQRHADASASAPPRTAEPLDRESAAAAEQVYAYGQLDGVCDFIEQHYFKALDNRDLRWANELVVKTVFLTVLFNDIVYITDSETALERRYADLSLMIRPDCRHYKLLDHVLEFKYLSLSALGLTAETALQTSRAELLALPLVADKISEAQGQLAYDRTILQQVYGEKLRLRTHAVVSLGLTRLVWA